MVHASEYPTESPDWDLEAHLELARHRELCAAQDEIAGLKRLLRENGISWSPLASAYLQRHGDRANKRRTRAETRSSEQKHLSLPVEVILSIMQFALTSHYPIIDPLSALTTAHMTYFERYRGRKNQIAIHATATCKGLRQEALKYFWSLNTFTFTTPEAFRKLGMQVPLELRALITQINFRIVAHYFDDCGRRHHVDPDHLYHPNVGRVGYPIATRPRDSTSLPQGFRCNTWSLLINFLAALRAPPEDKIAPGRNRPFRQSTPRPRLLPGLSILCLDFVNFFDWTLGPAARDLHLVASHDLRGSLDEIQVTGMPDDTWGMGTSVELAALLKRDGLYLESLPRYLRQSKGLKFLSGRKWCSRVMTKKSTLNLAPRHGGLAGKAPEIGPDLPVAPKEVGHPECEHAERYLWKRVPTTRDSSQREWVKFHRARGYPIQGPFTPFPDSETLDEDDEDFGYRCAGCGQCHACWDFEEEEEEGFGIFGV